MKKNRSQETKSVSKRRSIYVDSTTSGSERESATMPRHIAIPYVGIPNFGKRIVCIESWENFIKLLSRKKCLTSLCSANMCGAPATPAMQTSCNFGWYSVPDKQYFSVLSKFLCLQAL